MTPRPGETRYLLAGPITGAFYRMAHVSWGDPAAPPVLCVHGLTRTGRDFDALARALARDYHVICPDLPGRGHSDWLPDAALYEPMTYVTALGFLLASIGRPILWVGTSLGGICGMLTAAMPGQPIRRMVLNDIGPFIPSAALNRIRNYMGRIPSFESLWALEQHLRDVHAPFGRLTDPQWAHLAETSARVLPNGRFALHYDPGIATPIRKTVPINVDLWSYWSRIGVPMLAIRGVDSDLLLPQTLARMVASGAEALVVAEAGHAPALMDAPTIEAIRSFLKG